MAIDTTTAAVDQARLDELLGKVVLDASAAMSGALVLVGDRLGLYRGLAEGGPQTSAELAARTGTHERYVREWLLNQAAGELVSYDADSDRYLLTPEQAAAFADDDSTANLHGLFQIISDVWSMAPTLVEAIRTGRGVGWHEHTTALFAGTERFFRAGYRASLVDSWIPALDGVEAKLRAGARVADVGCGHGASTLLMARAYPSSRFVGSDYHPESIERARESAAAEGLADRVEFEAADAVSYGGRDYDLVAFFDCLHDMGDPVSALRHARESLAPDGVVMIVEPFAGDDVQSKLNPVGRLFAAASTFVCVANALSQNPEGPALGAQCGEAALREVVAAAGFSRVRRATETPFNIIYEVRV